MLDSKIESVRLHFGIEKLSDWQNVEPAWIRKIDGVGPKTLEFIRVMLAGHDMTLKGDETPEHWKKHGISAERFKLCQSISDDDVCDVTEFTVVVDTREQHGWTFLNMKSDEKYKAMDGVIRRRPLVVRLRTATLETGDYSIVGLEDQIAIERKSLPDLYGTLGTGRARFERELERLNSMKWAAVIIEAGWNAVRFQPPPHAKLSPKSVTGSICAFGQRYPRVHWFPMPTREMAEQWALKNLKQFWKDSVKKENPRHDA